MLQPISSRTTQLGLLLALATLAAPATATLHTAPAAQGQQTVEQRLSRLTAALQDRGLARPQHTELALGFINGRYGGAARGPRGRGFVNGHRYYGGPARGFVNGGGYRGGSFANLRPGRGFVNW
ncbi:rSAM-associated Gly-rich repeat protein [Synechococcus sp. RSCCF101]|uniref:GrrA/OscA1 family cyclophane-containing rSAM-modified RiPP n=1 Tax=Synechococcus sp. RSCCF101 TaxID=2511069 RepID=UPI001245078E|nr:GrrA/OscA1 family cyclophane-containing rSAM-modified RiPP [Synechococcus sp. RSCCF101]QEY31021.1 rSAM-associated Gly-rich repeat protein [Synechococcus sp. RSCCF101]